MKTLKKVKAFTLASLMTVFTLSVPARSIAGTGEKNSAVSVSEKYSPEFTAIKEDLSNIQVSKLNLKCLKEKLHSDRSAGLKETTIADRKSIMKTKADLRRDKRYLRADRWDLAKDHRMAVKNSNATVRSDKKQLCSTKKQLKKDVSKNTGAEQQDRILVTFYEKKLEQDRLIAKQEKSGMSNDRIAIQKEIKRSNTEFASTYANNTYTCTPNRVLK